MIPAVEGDELMDLLEPPGVDKIARHFRLRLGPNVLDIINEAFDPAGKPAGTGTNALTVERDILQARH